MSDDQNMPPSESETPSATPAGSSPAKIAEKQRLAEALRANLKRRKAQARERRGDSSGNSGSADE
jgi:hypothetical protein